ncbi:MAG: hypothetical protein KDJ15_05565, partial [Alphaproteobacteria bacterium]|nr:hypothetical protein [Alphaproteobacteria bacterium]
MIRCLVLLSAVFFFCLAPLSSQAAEAVPVRAGAHEGYSRLVFDWPDTVRYEISGPQDDRLTISFFAPGALETAGLDLSGMVVSALATEDGPDKTVAVLTIPPGSTFRHFTIGSRVILDVYGSAPEPVRAETETKKTKTPVAPETKEISSETVEAIRKALRGGVL